ncbi:MAG: Gfo/Idh/MocA family oxidoreductase [Elusimicrobiota bacterium]
MEKLRIGMIGLVGRGGIAKHWHQPNGRSVVVAGADINDKSIESFKTNVNPDAKTYKDYRQMLENKDIDAIAITTPDFLHEEQAVAALDAGKHVFCEKPLAITIPGCDRILRAWKKSGNRMMVGFNMRYMNIFRTMKDIADSGVLGEIKAVWVRHFVGLGGDYYYHDWHAKQENATSLLLQKGSHDIDIIHWITGSYGKKVSAFGSLDFYGGDKPNDLTCPNCKELDKCNDPYATPRRAQCAFRKEVDIEDNNVVIMELANGVKASYLQCHFTPDYHRNYVFIGTEGSMENSEPEMKVWVKFRKGKSWKTLADRTHTIKPAQGGHSGADPTICKDFVDMILDGKEPVAPVIAGRHSVAVGCAAAESMRSGGKVVEIPEIDKQLLG